MQFNDYQKKALATAINHEDRNLVFFDRLLGLVGETGEMAEKVKKWIRDDKAVPAKLDKEMLADELGDVLWYMATLAEYLGYDLDDIAAQNLEKLASRKKRGKLSGSGDKR
jgi:NTP pyrophosphatase (non-canonical NTP hydrolase)